MKKASFFALVLISALHCLAGFNAAGQKGVMRSYSAKARGKLSMDVGVGINVGQSYHYVAGPVDNNELASDVYNNRGERISLAYRDLGRQLSANIHMGLGILSFWDIAVSFPVYYDMLGFDEIQDGGFGDLEISTKLLYPAPSERLFYQSYILSSTIPVGMKKQGLFPRQTYYLNHKGTNPAKNFYSSPYPAFKAMMLWTFDIQHVQPSLPLLCHMNLGGVLTTFSEDMRNTAMASISAEYTPVDFMTVFTELHWESRISNFSSGGDLFQDPFYITPGIKLKTPNGSYLTMAMDFSLSSRSDSDRLNWQPTDGKAAGYRYSSDVIPRYAFQFQFGWEGFLTEQDDDGDGIRNSKDKCPNRAEDIDGFEDSDGCPDPDNDEDGVPDSLDSCPDEPEDLDGFEDSDGCPDLDNDSDGIADKKDRCPDEPEDFDGFEDQDGCPDPDNDGDGVPDTDDRCPNQPEDKDGFEDEDGCPDIDNDKDGILDVNDSCPDDPELFNGFEDEDGCPDTVKQEVNMPEKQLLHGILFRSGTAEMTFDSYQAIDPLVRTLKHHPEVEVEIRAHTEGVGDASKNLQLSQDRAEAVRRYILSKGVSPDRVKAVGKGASEPVADNKTAAGRAQNRRVEVIRLK
ncbi:MAG: OmpA family protein [Chitinispirillaceae bacterium]